MRRKIFTGEGHYHFVTFICKGRRTLLKDEEAKGIIVHILSKLVKERDVNLIGFVIMPEHVHAILGYPDNDDEHSIIMQEIKRRTSRLIRKHLEETNYPEMDKLTTKRGDKKLLRIWQPKYYDFNLSSEKKLIEKLGYMHQNPVKRGLVTDATDYKWSSSRHYELGKSVGVEIRYLV